MYRYAAPGSLVPKEPNGLPPSWKFLFHSRILSRSFQRFFKRYIGQIVDLSPLDELPENVRRDDEWYISAR